MKAFSMDIDAARICAPQWIGACRRKSISLRREGATASRARAVGFLEELAADGDLEVHIDITTGEALITLDAGQGMRSLAGKVSSLG